jgi:hypothetical protein
MKHLCYIVIVLLVAAGLSVPAFAADAAPAVKPAATAAPAAPNHTHLTGDAVDTFHKPADWLTLNADVRLRWEYAENTTTLDDEISGDIASYFRYRGRLGATISLDKDVDFNVRLVYEPRTYLRPNSDNPYQPGTAGPTRINEAVFDKFNFTMRNFLELPLTVVVGRQDIAFGKGWLVADGGPMDTSRTAYLDAVRLTWTLDKENTLDMVYARQTARQDMWLHPINDQKMAICPQDEHDAMLYWTNKSYENTTLEGYFLYRNGNPVNNDFPNSGFAAANSRKDEVSTYGGAVSQSLNDNWAYRVEGAVQFGNKQDSDGKMQSLSAWGTNNVLTYNFNDPCQNTTRFGWEYLTGDKRSTDKIEQFDPMWGKWARWSDLYANTMGMEAGSPAGVGKGEWTNLNKFNVGHSLKLADEWTLSGDYFLLLAPEHPLADSDAKFGNGNVRGHLVTSILKYQCCKQFSTYLQGEYLFPGNYYSPDKRDEAMFIRLNVEYVF